MYISEALDDFMCATTTYRISDLLCVLAGTRLSMADERAKGIPRVRSISSLGSIKRRVLVVP